MERVTRLRDPRVSSMTTIRWRGPKGANGHAQQRKEATAAEDRGAVPARSEVSMPVWFLKFGC